MEKLFKVFYTVFVFFSIWVEFNSKWLNPQNTDEQTIIYEGKIEKKKIEQTYSETITICCTLQFMKYHSVVKANGSIMQ